jgi:glycosyltransferase involved in cell wall biosynthesis
MTLRRRVLLCAYQCAPGQGSVSQIGWEWYSRLAQKAKVTLVTHIRNRAGLQAAGAPIADSEVIYIDTEWFAGPLYRLAKRLFPKSEHSVFLLSSLDYFVYDRDALKLLKPRRKEWDLVHIVTPISPSAFTVMTKLGLPVVRGPLNGGLATPTNFDEFMRADSPWLYPLRYAGRPFEALLGGGSADVVLTANAATEAQLSPKERSHAVRMVEIAVEPSLYRATDWPEAPGPGNPLKVLFVGRLVPFKALPLLFEAVRRVQTNHPVELTVVGDGPMRQAWEQAATPLGGTVRFLGAQPAEAVSNEMSRCHVLCLPSVRESGGMVLLEAMSAARPVIALNYGGPKELVNDKVGRLVSAEGSAHAIDGLTAALQSVIADPAAWRQRGLDGRRHAELEHAWDKRIEEGLRIYSEIQ